MPEFRILPLAELVEPHNPARTEMSDERMNSLVVSIRELGVLEPLHVKPAGDHTWEIVAGHRRLLASRVAGLTEVPCIVLAGDAAAEAVKIHENLEREDLSPSDEAIFYAELMESNGDDVDAVCALVKRTRAHVEGRLNLIRGDKHVFEALSQGKISIGVANELNAMRAEDDRLFHLDYCIRTGATVSTARQWRIDANLRAERSTGEAAPPGSPGGPNPLEGGRPSTEVRSFAGAAPWELDSSTEVRPCAICATPAEAWRMLKKHLCAECAENIWPRFISAFRRGDP